MRMIFGVLSLLIVLAIIGTVGKKQFEAMGLVREATTRSAGQGAEAQAVTNAVMGRAATSGAATVAVPGGMPGAEAAVVDTTIAGQSRTVQQNVLNQTNAAIQKGVDRNANAQP
jgi:predicted lipid-binding transport protein (Tim44 family)